MHPRQCFNAANVSVRICLKRLRAERAAEGDHPFTVPDAGEPFTARDGFFADGALNECAVDIASIKVHTSSFLSAVFCKISSAGSLR